MKMMYYFSLNLQKLCHSFGGSLVLHHSGFVHLSFEMLLVLFYAFVRSLDTYRVNNNQFDVLAH